MKIKIIGIILSAVLLIQFLTAFLVLYLTKPDRQDAVEINGLLHACEDNWQEIQNRNTKDMPESKYSYSIVDYSGKLLFASASGISVSLNEAVAHRDTILDLEQGKLIIHNEEAERMQTAGKKIFYLLLISSAGSILVYIGYGRYLNRTIFLPFKRMERFAARVASGNLEEPLVMDQNNIFGAFTESFDVMREELKKAREKEYVANQSKKELIAQLSHDIKTPVASIIAVSEVAAVQTADDKMRQQLTVIGGKAQQINELISNLFHGTLEELQELEVKPQFWESKEIYKLLTAADYKERAVIGEIPPCIVQYDILRLQQVFDNLFANSYKYADTKIEVTFYIEGEGLAIEIHDFGPGVEAEELSLIMGKFYRGKNTQGKAGAGLGLYISAYLMERMGGMLECANLKEGFLVTLWMKI